MSLVANIAKMERPETFSDKIELIVVALTAIGTVFVFSAGAYVVKSIHPKNFYQSANLRKVLFFPSAVAVMLLVSRIDYRKIGMQKCFMALARYLLAHRRHNFTGNHAHSQCRNRN